MKKTISILLTLTLILAMIPATAFASATDAATLNKLKLSDVKAYDKPLPTNGTKVSRKKMEELLFNEIRYNPPGKGTVEYNYSLEFWQAPDAPKGEYFQVTKEKYWMENKSQYGVVPCFTETKYIKNDYNESLVNKTHCWLATPTKNYIRYYSWYKGEKTGTYRRDENPNKSRLIYFLGDAVNFKLYKDATILGQKCLVFSFESGKGKEKVTFYQWISKKNRVAMKRISVDNYGTHTSIYFDTKMVNKPASFYEPPKDVKFKTVTQ